MPVLGRFLTEAELLKEVGGQQALDELGATEEDVQSALESAESLAASYITVVYVLPESPEETPKSLKGWIGRDFQFHLANKLSRLLTEDLRERHKDVTRFYMDVRMGRAEIEDLPKRRQSSAPRGMAEKPAPSRRAIDVGALDGMYPEGDAELFAFS